MHCHEIHDLLLEASPHDRAVLESEDVGRHLDECPACRDEVDHLEGLWARSAGIPESLEPSADLWPGIEARLAVRPRPSRVGGWILRLAAALVLLLGGALVDRHLVREPEATAAGDSLARQTEGRRASHLDRGREGWAEARATLWRHALQRRTLHSPDEVGGLLEGLEAVEEARWALEAALASDPGQPKVLAMLERTRRRELSLLRRLALPSREAASEESEGPRA